MEEISIDLSKQVFQDGTNLFKENDTLFKIKHKNYIFARNGSGKSTLVKVIKEQREDEYDIRIFRGVEEIIGENKELDAIELYDSEKDKQNKDEINKIERKIEELNVTVDQIRPDEIAIKRAIEEQNKKLENFYKKSAKSIKENTKYRVDANYNKTKFKRDIDKHPRSVDNLDELLQTISETTKMRVGAWKFPDINLSSCLESTNQILKVAIKPKIKISELDENSEKQNWAKRGLELHKDDNTCSFCGNPITVNRKAELKTYFEADEVLNLQNRLKKAKAFLVERIRILNDIEVLKQEDFYTKFNVEILNSKLRDMIDKYKIFLVTILDKIDEKERNLFSSVDQINLSLPESIDNLKRDILQIINENNEYGNNLEQQISDAKEKILLHLVKEQLDNFNYNVELQKVYDLSERLNKITNADKNGILDRLNQEIERNRSNLENLKKEISNPNVLIDWINDRLKQSGQANIRLKYVETHHNYQILNEDGTTREITKLSTGEKNIIAFLYFVGQLGLNTGQKAKIIIFDDPMTSNDDTMQYLIISELLKTIGGGYGGKYKKRFDPNKDFLLILTHNIHFYLNIQPHGNFKDVKIKKDENGKAKKVELSKYDKNNFYHLQNGKFRHIKSEEEDFTTSYDALWMELQELVKLNLRNSMLNSMRRIIETYVEFTKINRDEFYQKNEQYLKLFNVNSHSAVDDMSAQSFTETAEELKQVFKQIFIDNGAEEHFRNHWKDKYH